MRLLVHRLLINRLLNRLLVNRLLNWLLNRLLDGLLNRLLVNWLLNRLLDGLLYRLLNRLLKGLIILSTGCKVEIKLFRLRISMGLFGYLFNVLAKDFIIEDAFWLSVGIFGRGIGFIGLFVFGFHECGNGLFEGFFLFFHNRFFLYFLLFFLFRRLPPYRSLFRIVTTKFC